MIGQDAKLTDHGSYYDFEIEGGDIKTVNSLDAYIITCLFTDARADEHEVLVPEYRRGWIGNLGYDYQIGSKIWLYAQSRIRAKDFIRLSTEIEIALKKMIEDNIATNVSAQISLDGDMVILNLDIERPNGTVDHRYYELWDNTGL